MTQLKEVQSQNGILEGSQRILSGFERLRMENSQLAFEGSLGKEIGVIPVMTLEKDQEKTVFIKP